MTAAAEKNRNAVKIEYADSDTPILIATGRDTLSIKAGAIIEIAGRAHGFEVDTPVELGEMTPGRDYGVSIDNAGKPVIFPLGLPNPLDEGFFAGFHFAPGGCATGKSGGDTVPAINPYSIWDIGFRPSCADPRGMALIEMVGGKRFWSDIYLLGVEHHEHGTSRHGAVIADGRDLPMKPDGSGKYKKLDYATAAEIASYHGKRLLGAEEFFAAAYGVEERCSRSKEPKLTGELGDGAERFVSRYGLFDATGTMWQWGTDGHPDAPRSSIFGGSWIYGDDAGSRYAYLDYWAASSYGILGSRAASDHLGRA